MKSKEELNTLKEEVEALKKKLRELSDEELKQVVGGSMKQKILPHELPLDDYIVKPASTSSYFGVKPSSKTVE